MTDASGPTAEDLSPETELETSLHPAEVDPGLDFGAGPADDTDGPPGRAGYDVDAVSGDSQAVRPQ